jgi:Aminoglycoside adenylyltransferase, C-terminal domain
MTIGDAAQLVEEITQRYLALADERVPRRIDALYIVGSVALNDFRPPHSDIDFIAVVADGLDPAEFDALERSHQDLDKEFPRPHFSGVYVTWADLKEDPRGTTPLASHHEGRFHRGRGFDANPIQWLTLKTNPIAYRGPASPDVWTDPDAVHAWTLDNLNTYWRPWITQQRRLVGKGVVTLSDWGIAWGVLGVPRLHYTLATGHVTSKSGAGDYALSAFDATWHPIINEALRLRRDDPTSNAYHRRPLRRRRDALDFMTHVLDDADGNLSQAPTGS